MENKLAREELYDLLGELPPRNRKVVLRNSQIIQEKPFYLEKMNLDLNGIEDVPAYYIRPEGSQNKKLPCIIYNHAHGNNYELGKDEILHGRKALKPGSYHEELLELGYSIICIDHWCFGERNINKESHLFKEMLWQGKTLWGGMVYDTLKVLDYMSERTDIDSKRIGTLGISMGSTLAWWVAALDDRIKVCVDLCCMSHYHELIKKKNLDYHGIYYYVPRLIKKFSTEDINKLIVPRAHLSLNGTLDPLTPEEGLKKINKFLSEEYGKYNSSNKYKMINYAVGHEETYEMRKQVLSFLKENL